MACGRLPRVDEELIEAFLTRSTFTSVKSVNVKVGMLKLCLLARCTWRFGHVVGGLMMSILRGTLTLFAVERGCGLRLDTVLS